jgi:RNA polymerase sigma-70 factor (ECF subfamily)
MGQAIDREAAENERILLLVREARGGSQSALNQLVGTFRPRLLAIIAPLLPSRIRRKQDASDVAQDCLLEVCQCLPQFRGDTFPEFVGWITTIARNEAANARTHWGRKGRSVHKEQPLPDGSGDGGHPAVAAVSPSQDAAGREEEERLQKAMKRLPEDYQEVLRLRDLEGLEWTAVAEQLGRRADAVKQLRYRAIQQLKKEMQAGHEP